MDILGLPGLLLAVVIAGLLLGALALWPRLVAAFGWKRMPVGCALLALALAIAIAGGTLVLERAGWPWIHLSPLELVMPSRATEDPHVADALLRALTGTPEGPLPTDEVRGAVEVTLEEGELEQRLRSVPGWDLIVILGPFGDGRKAAADPRITSYRLRRQLNAAVMLGDEFMHVMLLIVRGDDIVARPVVKLVTPDWPPPGAWIISASGPPPAIRYDEDPELATALKRALVDQPSGELVFLSRHPQLEIVDVMVEDFEQFQERLRRVPGWDLIVLLLPGENGQEAALDPRITSQPLRNRIAARRMLLSEGFHVQLLAIRGEDIVAQPIVRLVIGEEADEAFPRWFRHDEFPRVISAEQFAPAAPAGR